LRSISRGRVPDERSFGTKGISDSAEKVTFGGFDLRWRCPESDHRWNEGP